MAQAKNKKTAVPTKAVKPLKTKAKVTASTEPVRKTRAARNTEAPKTVKSKTDVKCKHCNKKFPVQTLINGHCRLCFISTWKANRLNAQIKAEQRLNTYVDRLVRKYPKDYLEKLKEGLENESKFNSSVEELEIEPNRKPYDEEDEAADNEFLEKFVRDIKIEE